MKEIILLNLFLYKRNETYLLLKQTMCGKSYYLYKYWQILQSF